MHSIVCVKEILDPLGIAQLAQRGDLRVDTGSNRLAGGQGIASVMSPFDEQAVEAALRIGDKHSGEVTILSMGPKSSAVVVKHALAMGADQGIVLHDELFAHADGYSTATTLVAAIKKIGAFDLIFCGRQAADTDDGQVGAFVAGMLGIPCVTVAKGVEIAGHAARVTRALTYGIEIVESPLPAVVTVSNELGEPRYPSLAGIMKASRKAIAFWSCADIGVDPTKVGSSGARVKMVRLTVPRRQGMCEFIDGETPSDAGRNLALALRDHGLI